MQSSFIACCPISPSSNLLALKYSSKIFFTRGIRTPPPNISTECTLSKVKPAIDNAGEVIEKAKSGEGDGKGEWWLKRVVWQLSRWRLVCGWSIIWLHVDWLLCYVHTLVNRHSQSCKHVLTSCFKFTSSDLRVQIRVVVELFGFDGILLIGG